MPSLDEVKANTAVYNPAQDLTSGALRNTDIWEESSHTHDLLTISPPQLSMSLKGNPSLIFVISTPGFQVKYPQFLQ